MSGCREPGASPATMLPPPRPRSQYQWTPLHLAANAEVAQTLLAAGAKVDAETQVRGGAVGKGGGR
eukprot:4959977-Prymnesium_polylepis.1